MVSLPIPRLQGRRDRAASGELAVKFDMARCELPSDPREMESNGC